jgi:hypothetical protein
VITITLQPDAFNYIEGLRLIIVAIGVTKILHGLGWVLEHRRLHGIFWVHTIGAVLVVFLQLQFAWVSFYDYSITAWSFGDFLLGCATPLIYLSIAHLLFPDAPPEKRDFIKTYRSNIPLIGGLAIVAQVVNSALDYRFHPAEARLILQHVIRGVVVIVLCGFFLPFPRFKRIHEVVVVLLIVALIIFCLFLTPSIQIR